MTFPEIFEVLLEERGLVGDSREEFLHPGLWETPPSLAFAGYGESSRQSD